MKIEACVTDRQADVIRAIQEFLSDQGRNPTLAELADRAGLRSTNSIRRHLVNLEKLGVVKPRPRRKARAIALVDRALLAAA